MLSGNLPPRNPLGPRVGGNIPRISRKGHCNIPCKIGIGKFWAKNFSIIFGIVAAQCRTRLIQVVYWVTVTERTHEKITAPAATVVALAQQIFGTSVEATLTTATATVRVNGSIAEATLCSAEQRCPLILKAVDHGLHEADAYRALAEGGAPIASFYTSFFAADGREVQVLERLARVGIDGSDPEAFGTFVDTLAHFNATSAAKLPKRLPPDGCGAG